MRTRRCRDCGGDGRRTARVRCPTCRGTGQVPRRETRTAMHNAYVPGDMVRLRTAMPALRWRLRVLRVVGHTTRGVNIYELEYVTGPGAGRVTSASGADIRKVAE